MRLHVLMQGIAVIEVPDDEVAEYLTGEMLNEGIMPLPQRMEQKIIDAMKSDDSVKAVNGLVAHVSLTYSDAMSQRKG